MTDTNQDKQGDKTPSEPVRIYPISFQSEQPRKRLPPVTAFKWLVGVLFGVILTLLCTSAWFVFTARQVVITIAPVADTINISGGILTPRIGSYYLMRPGRYRLEALKECFFPLDHQFRISTEKRQNLNLKMRKRPGRINLLAHQSGLTTNNITGARVFVDGTETGITPIENLEIMPGLHRLEIRAENYQHLQADVNIHGCGELQEFNLALLPAWSDVTVNSVPEGATVRIDGKLFGNTPLRIQVAAGTYTLEVGADRHKTWKKRLAVKPNKPIEIKDVRLEPADGKLAIKTTPAGANLVIGGSFIGQSPLVIELSPSEDHVVHISKAGHEKATRNVRVSPAESKQLIVHLKPREGFIRFLVEPAGSELLVNGKSIGAAPKQLHLLAVTHTLEFKKKGYLPYRTRITPRPGFPQQLKITLKKEHAAKDAIPAVITAKTDYALKLIRPQPFVMGSSRREQGRRSNETLRKIKLTRPFYMGIKEVTNKEFKQFMPRHSSGAFKSQRLSDTDQPVVRVTWEEAALFCNWLSAKESLPPAYIKKEGKLVAVKPLNTGFRLPTEAEWEYCARFVSQQSLLKYPWGHKFPPESLSGNYSDQTAKDLLPGVVEGYNDGYAAAAPPGNFKPNSLGLYDMGGNVAEWCHDYYSIYSHAPEKTYVDPVGRQDGKHHVIRGSSWKSGSISTLRLAYRGYSDGKREDVGFRVCRYLK